MATSTAGIRCASYDIAFLDRRTQQPVATVPVGGVDAGWTRRLDFTSDAFVTVKAPGPECCADLARVFEHGHELAFFREGSPQPVWQGPVTAIDDDTSAGEIIFQAQDRSYLWSKRTAKRNHFYTDQTIDVLDLFLELLDDADSIDPVGLARAVSGQVGVLVERAIFQNDPIIPSLVALADVGVDWTVVGTGLLIGAVTVQAPIGVISNDDFEQGHIRIQSNGPLQANYVVVQGQASTDGQIEASFPAAPNPHPFFGLHEKTLYVPEIATQAEALRHAQSYYERNFRPPNFALTGDSNLAKTTSLMIQDLIPGRSFQASLEGACRTLSAPQRLSTVDVTITDGEETEVKIDFQPLGSTEATV